MDWFDIILHGVIALAATLLVGYWNRWIAVTLNTIIWPAREIMQHGYFSTSPQSTLEWVVPVLAGFLVFLIYGMKENG